VLRSTIQPADAPTSILPYWITPRMVALVKRLESCVNPTRVFSVFGATALVKAFTRHWIDLTGFVVELSRFILPSSRSAR